MNSGIDGPVVEGRQPNSSSSYKYAFASCPNPYNPTYLRDLNWGTWETITASQENKEIQPGRYYFIEGADGSEIAVEFRTAEGFGRYTGWYRFDQAPGLMIWKRSAGAEQDEPRLVPADNRSVYNATMGCPPQPDTNHPPCTPATGFTGTITEGRTPRSFSSSAVYPCIDRISDPFGALEGNGMRSTFLPLPTHTNGTGLPATPTLARPDLRPVGTQAADDSHLRRNSFHCPNNDDAPSRLAFRNIRVTRNTANPATGSALVDIYFDHWVGPIDGIETWGPDSVYVGGDVTIERGTSVTIAAGTTVNFLAPTGPDASDYPELIVSAGAHLTVGTGVTFGTVDRAGARTDTHGVRVESGGTATLNGVTIAEGEHRWSGPVTVGGDLVVGDGTNAATLRLEAGTEVRFEDTDEESDGQDEARVELIVENGGTLQAGAGHITFRSASDAADASNDDWYGIRVAATGIADLSGATIRDGRRCLQLRGASTVSLTNTTLTNCGLTVDLTGTPPVLGGRLTASLDPGDGSTLNEEFWQWQGRASATDAWANLAPSTRVRYPAKGTYIPKEEVLGQMLRATLRYRARFGGGAIVYNYAQSAPTAAVAAGRPGALANCTTVAGSREVMISCDPAEAHGSPVTGNEYRRSSDGGATWDPDRWVTIPPAARSKGARSHGGGERDRLEPDERDIDQPKQLICLVTKPLTLGDRNRRRST